MPAQSKHYAHIPDALNIVPWCAQRGQHQAADFLNERVTEAWKTGSICRCIHHRLVSCKSVWDGAEPQ